MRPAAFSFVKRGLVNFKMKMNVWSTIWLLLTDSSVLASGKTVAKFLTGALFPSKGDLMVSCAVNKYPWQKLFNYPSTTKILQINPKNNINRKDVIIVGAFRKEIK